MKKDRAAEYWDNEIKRAAENTAKALAEFQQAKKEEQQAHDRKIDAEVNEADAETLEEAREIYRRKTICKLYKWEAYQMASNWEGITRGAAESYKKRKAAQEENKQEPTQSKGRRQ